MLRFLFPRPRFSALGTIFLTLRVAQNIRVYGNFLFDSVRFFVQRCGSFYLFLLILSRSTEKVVLTPDLPVPPY